ncbi:MAG: 4-hydroxythreonine-4-phosphate dehydrogenase PdxA [Burkholderiaceae bacterium]|nr:4-hydroxythreonine-4-phosphate dehydrogenase PdxA [Burkholderiaceae bacterium]
MLRAAARHSLPLVVTMGDACGIGPEIVLKACADRSLDVPLRIVGDAHWLAREAVRLSLPMPSEVDDAVRLPDDLPVGRIDARAGDAAWRCIVRAAQLALRGEARALVTAPIAKEAMHAAGHHFPGHTELLAELAGGVDVRMMLANPELRVVLVSIHVALREAVERLDSGSILETIRIADASMRRAGIERPRIAVAGLNPHAGEGGLFGREEIEIIAPAIAKARTEGIEVSGPFAPDTVFMRARGMREFDLVVAMYHDQGLIPVKYLGIDDGVNVTLGLPFVRTSPDHGTAFDKAGRSGPDGHGLADARSLVAAIRQASALSAAVPSAAAR